jgi:hypothetical protein
MTKSNDGLTDDERQAGNLANAITSVYGDEAAQNVLSEMPARDANRAQRAMDIGKQLKRRRA